MAEQINLTTPELHPSNPTYILDQVILNVSGKYIRIDLIGANGEQKSKTYDGGTIPTGATLLHNLNIGNFSGTTSLIKAIYNRLFVDGVLVGTVSGTAT